MVHDSRGLGSSRRISRRNFIVKDATGRAKDEVQLVTVRLPAGILSAYFINPYSFAIRRI